MITFDKAQQYILDIPKFAGKHTLEDTGRLLDMLTGGNRNSKIILVAGTNGKGSVCAYLRSLNKRQYISSVFCRCSKFFSETNPSIQNLDFV